MFFIAAALPVPIPHSAFRIPPLAFVQLVLYPALDVRHRDADLLHRVPVADGGSLVFQRIEVNGDAPGRADLILPAVSAADTSRLVVVNREGLAEVLVQILRD